MKKILLLLVVILCTKFAFSQTNIVSGRLNEVFRYTTLVPAATNLNDPWEITYGPDDSLWITEARGYQVRKVHPTNGGIRTILDLRDAASGGSFSPSTYRRQFAQTQNPWPQGGMMGLAIHPDYNHLTTPKKYIYIAYVRSYTTPTSTSPLRTTNPFTGEVVNGRYFTTWLVRFTYDGSQLTSPVTICDSIPGSNDHNSGRIIINEEGGTPYLYYAVGDVGAGQFANFERVIKSQQLNSYEGKILRFNLEEDSDTDQGTVDYNRWIPNDNPFNTTLGVQSAVWAIGMRNNQGFATGTVNGNQRFYGSSHGPHSDDEINLIQSGKNYGHPLVIGYSSDGNYNNAKAGPVTSSLPLITSEAANATAIGSTYVDPMYSNYPAPAGSGATPWTPYYSIQTIYQNPNIDTNPSQAGTQQPQNNNGMWWSEGYSGLGLYTGNVIPGWKNSLLLASLKWGRVVRMKLNSDGSDVLTGGAGGQDTTSYFGGTNRFRDVAMHADGRNIYVVMDRSTSSSGPSAGNPIIPACAGCVQRYEFLGYNTVGGTSGISTTIPIDAGTANNCISGLNVTINSTNNNNNLWVPLTGPNGDIIAEINANGNNLGNVTSSFYVQSGSPVRSAAGNNKYMNRNITINVENQPTSNVSVRLYITATELADMISSTGGSVSGINDIGIFKNNDGCGNSLTATPTSQTITGRYTHGSFGHAIQADIGSFSTFYFMSTSSTLPVNLITFKATAVGDASKLQWTVDQQENVEKYIVERSENNISFTTIGTVVARGSVTERIDYLFTDLNAASFASTVYYRVKMQDKDGSYKYTNVIPVTFERFVDAFVTVQPNPVLSNASLMIYTNTDEPAQLRIVDNTGRTVMNRTIQLNKGKNTVELNVSNLPSGLYNIDVTGKTINQKTKLIKQ